MGGRGTGSGFNNWKSQLQKMAKQGKMPGYIAGSPKQQAMVLEEIDKLYSMPKAQGVTVQQYATEIRVIKNGATSRIGFPSGSAASDAEKNGALKYLLYRVINRKG